MIYQSEEIFKMSSPTLRRDPSLLTLANARIGWKNISPIRGKQPKVLSRTSSQEREKHKVIKKIGNYNENIEPRSSSQKVVVHFCSIAWGLYINPGIHTLQDL